MHDLRLAFRQLAKAPSFTAVAVLTLALGIGVTTALFSVVYGVLLDPYPYAKSNEIWAPRIEDAKTGRGSGGRYSDYTALAKMPAVASAMATAPSSSLIAIGNQSPEWVTAPRITGTALEFLGVPPVLGRIFTPADIKSNGEPETVCVLSFRFWQTEFNGAPDVIGRTLRIDDMPHVVIGVMPPRFGWYNSDGLWLPLAANDPQRANVRPIFRFKPGVTKAVAEQQLTLAVRQLAQEAPGRFPRENLRATFDNYLDVTAASGAMRSSLSLLFYAVGFLLLIACANVANLQLARAATRSREIAVRLALGASRGRLVRQLLTESVGLALAGGALGIFFAWGFTQIIVALMPDYYVPNEARVTLNGWVLAFSVGVAVLTGFLFGLAPALQGTRPDLNEALKDGGHASGVGGARGARTRSTLVVIEVALSIVLLVGATLATRGFVELQRTDRGVRMDHALILRVLMPSQRYPDAAQRARFARTLLDRLQALPGVTAAAIGSPPQFDGGSGGAIPGHPKIDGGIGLSLVSENYLAAFGIPLLAGRNFTVDEIERGDHLALISETAAKLWPAGESPLGRVIQIDALAGGNPPQPNASKEVTVIGIVGDTRTRDLRQKPPPVVLVPYPLRPAIGVYVVRTQGDPNALVNTIRAEVRALDPELPLFHPLTLEELLSPQIVQPRFNMTLFSGLAAVALALAAAGIYSVLSYSVAQRTREIGVRMALGAARGDILRLILSAGGRLLVIGLVIGIAASVALAKIVTSQVFTVPLLDPLALAAASLVLSAVALLACYIPARRATKVDPMVALRCE